MTDRLLPSWRDGATRSAIVEFLDAADEIAPERRVAVFDNDGTLWCEKPRYTQLDFFVWQLAALAGRTTCARATSPSSRRCSPATWRRSPSIGLERVAFALMGLFEGVEPEVFEARVQGVLRRDDASRPRRSLRRDALPADARADGGARTTGASRTASSPAAAPSSSEPSASSVYGVAQERVVGTLVTYELRASHGRPGSCAPTGVQGEPNEGAAKIANIQMALGRRPTLAAGNSPGDAEMLEYTSTADGPVAGAAREPRRRDA